MQVATSVVGVIKLEVPPALGTVLREGISFHPSQTLGLKQSRRLPQRINQNARIPTVHVEARLTDLHRELQAALVALCDPFSA